MNSSFAIKLVAIVFVLSLMTSCNSLEIGQSDSVESSIHGTTITTTETSVEEELLVEFTDYTTSKNDDGTFNITITQEAMKDCYYVISMMYDGNVLEYVDGDGYLTSHYGKFAGEDDDESDIVTSTEDEETEESTTTEDAESKFGKEGTWTLRSISEGTEYIEIKLINQYGDIVYKSQYTCIVDTHLEPHIYYTTINY